MTTMGGVVRYTVQAELFATVDRTLAERALAERAQFNPVASPSQFRPEPAARLFQWVAALVEESLGSQVEEEQSYRSLGRVVERWRKYGEPLMENLITLCKDRAMGATNP
ncbi:MAG: hypothetical protein ACO1SX_11810 [Actinomycetota bacterium]